MAGIAPTVCTLGDRLLVETQPGLLSSRPSRGPPCLLLIVRMLPYSWLTVQGRAPRNCPGPSPRDLSGASGRLR